MIRWVQEYPGTPPVSVFGSTMGLGSPIVVDTATDTPYYLKGGVVTPFASGGGGAVASVFGRVGAVVAVAGDYTFAQIGATPTTLAGYGISSTKAQFDTACSDGNFVYTDAIGVSVQGYSAVLAATTASFLVSQQTKLGHISVTQAVDLDAIESDTVTNNAKVTNATHTGDATGSGALTVVAIRGKSFPALGAGDDQKYPKYDNGTNAFVMTAIAGGGDVTGDDVSTTVQNIVAYSTTGGKNITELTGTQGDVLYHNGTNWAKLAAGTSGQYLRTAGSGANPLWAWGKLYNRSTANQGAGFATDTYLTGSNISIPNSSLKAGTVYKLVFRLTKTAAGTATPILTLRIGTAGTTADTARCTFTFTAGTAAIDDGMFEVFATFDTVGSGSSAVLRGTARCTHKLSVTGITGTAAVSETEHAVSAGFDSTVSNSIIGLSVNGGASAAWTVQHVMAEMENFV
jgi:hypothetical protein